MRIRKLSSTSPIDGSNRGLRKLESLSSVKPILYCIIISILLLSSVYVASSTFRSPPLQTASAQLGTTPSILPNLPKYVNPLGPDFLTLAIGLTPQLQGINLDLSNVQGVIRCDLTRPLTYISSACMSDLSLLLPITEQANSSSTNQSNTFNLSGNFSSSPISLSIGVVSDNLTAGDPQTVTVTATNASSGANIEGAEISSNVTDPSGNSINQYNGTTDATGQVTFTFTIPTDAEAGTYQVAVTANAAGFDQTTESSTFDVVSFDNSFDNSTNFDNGSSGSSDGSSSSDSGSSSSNNGDFTSPTVKSTDPKDNDNNVPVDTQITVTFSEKMDKNSIDTGSLSLVPDVGNSASISKVSVSGKSATFTVNNNLIPNMNYLATISSNAQDSAGNFLDCSGSSGVDSLCEWTFNTGTGSVKPVPPVILTPASGNVTNNKPVISGTVAGASLVTLKIEVFDGSSSSSPLGTTTAASNGAWSLTPKNALSEGSHTITAVAQNTNNNQNSDSSAPVTFTVTNGASITVTPTSGIVGGPFTVKGTAFDSNTDVTIEFDGSFGKKKSDNIGAFTVTFGVPASTAGVHTVKASEGSKSASKPFTVISSISLNPTSGPVGKSVSVTGNGFDSNSTVNLKFNSTTALSPAITDNKGSFTSAFTVPVSSGKQNVTAIQGSNTAFQSFTVTGGASSIKALGIQDNSSIVVSNSSSNATNASSTNNSKQIPASLSIPTNITKTENVHTTLSQPAKNVSKSIGEGNVLHLETSIKNNSSTSSPISQANTSVVKNLIPSALKTEDAKRVQDKIGLAHETAAKLKKSHIKEQLLNNKVVNISPIAKDDIVTTKQNIPLNIQVMNNDNDPNKKDKLSIIGLSPPQHGRVVSNSNGTFTYIPAPLWTGTDVFEYSVTDGRGGIATSTAKVTVEPSDIKNHVPKAIAQSVSLKENTHIQVLLKAKDPDKDRLSFNILEQPTHGKIVDFSSLSGSLVYIPDSNYVGHDAFKFKVNDGKDDSKESKVSIRVIADKQLQDNNKIIRLKPNLSQDKTQPAQTQNGNNTKNAEPPKSDQQQQLDQQLQQTLQNKDNNAQDDVQSQSKQDEATSSKDNVQPQPQQDQPSEQPQ